MLATATVITLRLVLEMTVLGGGAKPQADELTRKKAEAVLAAVDAVKVEDEAGYLSALALKALKSPPRKALPGLIERLQNRNKHVRFFSVLIIGRMGKDGRDALKPLITLLRDPDD